MSVWLTAPEAAKRVGKSVRTIVRWLDDDMESQHGLIREEVLLQRDAEMRARRGRPRKVDPRAEVMRAVVEERDRQDRKWGEQNHPNGTGSTARPLFDPRSFLDDDTAAVKIAEIMKKRTDERFAGIGDREGSWLDILLEEVFEAAAESNPEKLRYDLIQVAAVSVQWVEALDRR